MGQSLRKTQKGTARHLQDHFLHEAFKGEVFYSVSELPMHLLETGALKTSHPQLAAGPFLSTGGEQR